MIPGLQMEVYVDVAKPTMPRAWLKLPAGKGVVALQLDWEDEQSHARWTVLPVAGDPFARLLGDLQRGAISEPWRGEDGSQIEPLTPTAAVHLLMPVAQRWLQQPIRRVDSLAIWLRTELLLPQEVN